MRTTICLTAALLLGLATAAEARIKLTTLPERETVRIDIQNGRFTLVEEERTVDQQRTRMYYRLPPQPISRCLTGQP